MKYSKVVFVFFVVSMYSFGQENNLYIDLDHDKIKDTVFFDRENGTITCKLSSKKFKEIKNKSYDTAGDKVGIESTKSGFCFFENWMRAGYSCQFRYNNKLKKIELIGMSRYDFGNAANDGSGESSINLLTNNYIGNWNYYDEEKQELISIPTIKRKMMIKKTFLEDFSLEVFDYYSNNCIGLFEKMKTKMLNSKLKSRKSNKK
jgi:hypothetical protein